MKKGKTTKKNNEFKVKFDGKIFVAGTQVIENTMTKKSMEATIIKSPDWVQCLAITPDMQVVFVKQYRYGTKQVTMELPGGIVDGTSGLGYELAKYNAFRELEEETGYRANESEVVWLDSIKANPAFMTNEVYGVCVKNVERSSAVKFDKNEFCKTQHIQMKDLPLFVDFIDNPYSKLFVYGFMEMVRFNKKQPEWKPYWKELKKGFKQLREEIIREY